MANCHDLFRNFHEVIVLPDSKKGNLRKARDTIRERIKTKFADAKRTLVPEFLAQGSYTTQTIVNPIDGEYDIDDGVYLQNLDKRSSKDWPSPETVHKWVLDAVDGHTKTPPIDKRTCVRVIYKGQYHVDLPIYCELNGTVMHAEKGEKGWHKSNPGMLTEWFQNAVKKHGDQLRLMVRYIKAWVDYNLKDGKLPSGLVLTVLAVEKFQAYDRDDVSFGQMVTAMYTRMLANSCIINPVDPTEDLYARYDSTVRKRFLEALLRLKNSVQEALGVESKKDACRKWRKEFGDRWSNCDALEDDGKSQYTKKPALLRNDARSA